MSKKYSPPIQKIITWTKNKLSKKSLKFFIFLFLLLNILEHSFISFSHYKTVNHLVYIDCKHIKFNIDHLVDKKIARLNKEKTWIYDPEFDFSEAFKTIPLEYKLPKSTRLNFLNAKNQRHFNDILHYIKREAHIQNTKYCNYMKHSYRNGIIYFFSSFLKSFLSPEIFSPNIKSIYHFRPLSGNITYYALTLFLFITYLIANFSLLSWVFRKNKKGIMIISKNKITLISAIIIISWIFSILPFLI